MYVADYRSPELSLDDLREDESTCLGQVIDRMEDAGCTRLFRWNSLDMIYLFSCSNYVSRNETVDTAFKLYVAEHWDEEALATFKMPYESDYCQDDHYTVTQY
jgi:hypothetical protein